MDSTYKLDCGDYVIIPFPEDTGYVGDFTLAASAKNMDDIGLVKLPKSVENTWKELSAEVCTLFHLFVHCSLVYHALV